MKATILQDSRLSTPKLTSWQVFFRKKEYGRRLKDDGKTPTLERMKMHAVSCGLQVDDYRQIISEQGRINFGPPYLACFKTCLTMIATEMQDFAPEDQFAVILDRNPLQNEAVKIFYDLKKDQNFRHRSRFATCTPADSEELIALQPADLIAYETLRLLQNKRKGSSDVRAVLQSMFAENPFIGYYFESETLKVLKDPMESSKCTPNAFVISFPRLTELQALRRQGNVNHPADDWQSGLDKPN